MRCSGGKEGGARGLQVEGVASHRCRLPAAWVCPLRSAGAWAGPALTAHVELGVVLAPGRAEERHALLENVSQGVQAGLR